MGPMRVHLSNLGCKLNQAEIEALGRQFTALGHQIVPSIDAAEVHVINSCTVTHVADRSSRKLARRGARVQPGIKTVLTGCYATSSAEEAARLAGVDLVVDNQQKDDLVDMVLTAFPEFAGAEIVPELPYGQSAIAAGRSRAAVKIEDGCNMRCSFCIIPFTRGAQTSRSPQEIKQEVASLVADGLQEIVLTGVQISSYEWGDLRLYDLVEQVLEVVSPARLRLTSIAPWNFDSRLLELLADSSVCPHVHLSLQSGADATLERMRRPYSTAEYQELVAAIRQAQPTVGITTDVIVGFPGESEQEFAESLETVSGIQFAKIHAFPYSRRPGTSADLLDQHLDPSVIRQRMQQMLQVAEVAERKFYDRQFGRQLQVLWESWDNHTAIGTSDNYVKVSGHTKPERMGSLRRETIRAGENGQLWAA